MNNQDTNSSPQLQQSWILMKCQTFSLQIPGKQNCFSIVFKFIILISFSSLSEVTGDGLFAKRFIPRGSVVAYYAGEHLYDYDEALLPNMTIDEREDRHKNLLSYNDDYDLDCHDSNIVTYRATLGHKTNHAFAPKASCKFCFVKHPRLVLFEPESHFKN